MYILIFQRNVEMSCNKLSYLGTNAYKRYTDLYTKTAATLTSNKEIDHEREKNNFTGRGTVCGRGSNPGVWKRLHP